MAGIFSAHLVKKSTYQKITPNPVVYNMQGHVFSGLIEKNLNLRQKGRLELVVL